MKIYCILGLYLVFILSLLFGYNAGASLEQTANQIGNAHATAVNTEQDSQYNILIVLVDQIDLEQPHLLSVWLMAYYSNSSRVDLLPIYPSHKSASMQIGDNLQRTFELTNSREPVEGFWQALKEFNTWWNGYIMMDAETFQELESRFGGMLNNHNLSSRLEAITPIHPQVVSGNEAQRFQQLCQSFSQNSGSMGFYKLYFPLKQHLRSNLTPGQLQDVWRQLRSNGSSLECDFPTLQAMNP